MAVPRVRLGTRAGWSEGEWVGAWEGMISAESGIASRCAVSGTDSMAEWSQLSDIDSSSDSRESGGREGRKSILEFGGIGRERRCEGHQSGKERKRKGPFVRRKRERERKEGATASRMDQLEWREKREKLPPFPVLTLQCFLTALERD